ncbi:BTAD domain-containing putative transcriptional regulator [Kutzneria sp. 744]|uniref:BTAD domain-containing putative transcriptional regulator n=1 Tax=Kutzneria sp. (strain 744) TaxID=345341 RepID=UPI0003EEBE2F|nr:BTAD domain-containing putative transcriptional regulator [Kutzneria sp. 744]EWM18559.1 tetratricopeptide repeat protein [Kutzneria sp. 744]
MTSTESSRLRIQLLGPVRAWRGEAEIDLGRGRRRAVFAILAANANKAVSRTEFVDGIWGDAPPAKAVGILHTYISALRKALAGDGSILTTIESSYSLALEPDQLDEQQFEQHQRDAQWSWENGDLQAAVDALDAAVGRWHGDGLDGLKVPFAELYRARLAELKATALERRAALALILGHHVDATDGLAATVARFPQREGARGLLMAALYKAGRRDDALRLYDETSEILSAELGIDPGAALRHIRGRILDGEPLTAEDIGATTWMPRPAASAVDHLTALERKRPAVPELFVGRRPELARFTALLDDLDQGRGACVWVEGEGGIGKSSLLAKALAGDRMTVWARGDELAGPGKAIGQLLTAVEQACRRSPLVLVVEDIHLGRDTDLLAWTRLSRLTRYLPLLLAATCRTFPRRRETVQLHNAVHMTGGHVIQLEPLASNDVSVLAMGRLRHSYTASLMPLLRRAAGNPRHAHDILDVAVAAAARRASAAGFELDMAAVASGIAIDRLESLDSDTRDVLRWAALLGPEFYPGDLTRIMRVPAAALAGAIGEATTAGVLVETRDSLAFRDEAVRQRLLDGTEPAQRAVLHREAAETLAAAGAPVERVAAQLVQAVPPVDPWSFRWLLANAEAIGFAAPQLATELLTRAVAGPSLLPAEHEMLALRRIRLLGALELDPREDVAALLATTTDREIAGELHSIHAHLDYHFGAVSEALARLREAGRLASLPAHWRARYLTLRAQIERETFSDITVVLLAATCALDAAVAVGDPAAISEALRELWYAETVRRDHAAALRHVDRALAVTAGVPSLAERRMVLLDMRAITLDKMDRPVEASAALAQARAGSHRSSYLTARHHVTAAIHHYWLGRWDEAVADLDLADKHLLDSVSQHRSTTLLRLRGLAALIAVRRGDNDGAQAHLRALDAWPVSGRRNEDGSDFLLVARSIVDGDKLDPLSDLNYGQSMARHQWLPMVVRIGLEAGTRTVCRPPWTPAGPRPTESESRAARSGPSAGAKRWSSAIRTR